MSAQAAAKAGDLTGLTAALAAGAAVDASWGDGNTALHEAALSGSVDCVKLLLAKGADVHKRGRNDATPLIFAAGHATTTVLELLHAAGADVNAVSSSGTSALMYAAIKGRPETTEWLLKHGADVRLQTILKQTALNLVAGGPSEKEDVPNRNNFPVVAKLLLDAGAEVDSRDRDGWTPLYAAASCGETEIVKVLISAGADVSARDYGKGAMPLAATALHQACAGLYASTVEALVKAGAPVNAVDKRSRQPKDALPGSTNNEARQAARQACLYWLSKADEYDNTPGKGLKEVLKMGPEVDVPKVLAFYDKPKDDYDAQDVNAKSLVCGDYPLSLAVRWSEGPTWYQRAGELISRGADVNQLSDDAEPPLFVAARQGKVEMVKLLLRAGANVNWAKDGKYFVGFTPLIECLSHASQGDGAGTNYEETAMELLDAGASTDTVLTQEPNTGMKPLHFAIKAGLLRPVKAIIERGGSGADVYARVGFQTPILMAEVRTLSTGDNSLEQYLKSVAPPPPPAEPCCVIS